MHSEYGFPLPRPTLAYRSCALGDWKLLPSPGGISTSYVSRNAIDPPHAVLRRGGVDWMSTAMLELESHAWHLSRSRGVVVAAGLGMAFFAHAAARKPEVERVLVAERDATLPKLLDLACPGWDLEGKIETIVVDADDPAFSREILRRLSGRRPDYLYADIWPAYPDPDAPAWTSRLAKRLDPREAGWWGQELSFAAHCHERGKALSRDAYEAYFEEIGVPSAFTAGYLDFCEAVMDTHRDEFEMEGPRAA